MRLFPDSYLASASISLIAGLILASHHAGAEMLNWTTKFSPNFAEVRDVSFGAGTFVAVGDNNVLLHSSDAINWTSAAVPSGLDCDLKTVTFAFGGFYVGGKQRSNNLGVLLLSFDGANWFDITTQFPSAGGLASVNELFAASLNGQQALLASVDIADMFHKGSVFASNDGTVWMPSYRYNAAHAGNFFQDSSSVYGLEIPDAWHAAFMTWGKVAWGVSSINPSASITSFTSIWPMPTTLTRFGFGNSTYVGAGKERRLAFASNLSGAFTYASYPTLSDYTGVAFGRDMFVAVGTKGTVAVTYDLGRSWRGAKAANLQSINLNGVRYVGERFIAYGGGRIVTGEPVNKRDWSRATLPSGAHRLNSLATDGRIIVAVGQRGQILYSSTGTSWSKAAPATSRDLSNVMYDPPTKSFYATGANGTLLRSSNGRAWSVVKTPSGDRYSGVGRAGRALITLGSSRQQFLQSTDGKTWTRANETSINFTGTVVGDGSTAYVFGPAGRFLIKRGNARDWATVKGAPAAITDLTVINNALFVTGSNGQLYSTSQATPGTWKSVDTRMSVSLNGIANNAAAAKQIAAVGQLGLVYSQPKAGQWRLEMLEGGAPVLQDLIKFKNRWLVAGSLGLEGYIGVTDQN